MNTELIKALKENKEAFGLMSEEMQEAAREIGREDFLAYCDIASFESVKVAPEDHFDMSTAYRLRPDYEPEPEYEKCEITVIEDELCYKTSVNSFPIDLAPRYPNFYRFELHKNGEQTACILSISLECIATAIRPVSQGGQGHKCYAVFIKDNDVS